MLAQKQQIEIFNDPTLQVRTMLVFNKSGETLQIFSHKDFWVYGLENVTGNLNKIIQSG